MHPGDLAGGFSDLEMTWLLYCAGTATEKEIIVKLTCYQTVIPTAITTFFHPICFPMSVDMSAVVQSLADVSD